MKQEVTDDFSAICLIGDEATAYKIPFARNVISTSYFPAIAHSENKLVLNECEAGWLGDRMREIQVDIVAEHLYKKECLYSLYSLLVLDLLNVEKRIDKTTEIPGLQLTCS